MITPWYGATFHMTGHLWGDPTPRPNSVNDAKIMIFIVRISRNEVSRFPKTNANISSRNFRYGRGQIGTNRSNSRLSLGRLTPGFSWYRTIRNKACSGEKNTNKLLQTGMLYLQFIFEVKSTFEMLTMCGQKHSFSTHERMFLWKCQYFWTGKYLDLRGLEPPTFGFMPNALTIGAIRARRLLLTLRWQQHSFSTHERMFLWKCQSVTTPRFIWYRTTGNKARNDEKNTNELLQTNIRYICVCVCICVYNMVGMAVAMLISAMHEKHAQISTLHGNLKNALKFSHKHITMTKMRRHYGHGFLQLS